ncbi:DUF6910 family protein [Nocardioides sp. SYSU DS0651]|uniref:DUF6910 family protein n=1 Tax=Nocardioides sp. SYSU DS0651 TaxID=3415955 RepID=UPI003F4AFA28
MEIQVDRRERLRFADGSPVRAASAVAPFGDGVLVLQDDGTHGAWLRAGSTTPVRLLPPVAGLDTFAEAAGTKHLKPDFEAACAVDVDGAAGVLALGSGSSSARTRWCLARLANDTVRTTVVDAAPVYADVAAALGVPDDVLNLEGCCVVGDALRWFHRGLPSAGLPSGSVDLDLATVVDVALRRAPTEAVTVRARRKYRLGEVRGVGLGITDAVALPDGTVVVSAAAEDTPNPRDDGPVVGSALVRIDGEDVVDAAALPPVAGAVAKVEGLTRLASYDGGVGLLAVVDADDPAAASLALHLRVRL